MEQGNFGRMIKTPARVLEVCMYLSIRRSMSAMLHTVLILSHITHTYSHIHTHKFLLLGVGIGVWAVWTAGG
jgi:hypothetical protein